MRDPNDVLRSAFGYPSFRPGQEALVRSVLAGRDAVGVLPTGGGKSVCYQVPALMVGGLTLVITPLVSLMEDQVRRAREVGLAAACLTAGQDSAVRRRVTSELAAGRLRVLFVSPERLDVPAFRSALDGARVDLLAVDEAHCISEWGHDFRPAYRRIGSLRETLRAPVLALTASATPSVRADIATSLAMDDPTVVVRSFDRANLWWAVLPVPDSGRLAAVRRIVRRSRGCGIVYAPTRASVERVRDALAASGVPAAAYHGGMPGPLRSAVQERFMSGEARVVVATNAFGMGIDKPDVRFVCHLQLPTTPEAYYQEAGRAGRDGAPARCVAFHDRDDRRLGRRFIDGTHPPVRRLRWLHHRLRRLADRTGCVEPQDPRVLALLGPDAAEWLRGEPAGVPAALERARALRRVGVGTDGVRGGSPCRALGVSRRPDWRYVRDLRRGALARLDAVQRLASGSACRRNALLRYFGEVQTAPCGRCDRCGWDYETQMTPE